MAHITEVVGSEWSAAPSGQGGGGVAACPRRLNHLRDAGVGEHPYPPRGAVAEFARPVMLYSIGKGFLRNAPPGSRRRFHPGKIPFPSAAYRHQLYKFPDDDRVSPTPTHRRLALSSSCTRIKRALDAGGESLLPGNTKMLRPAERPNRCLMLFLKEALTLRFGGARRDEEKSRAKERIYSFRDPLGEWDSPKTSGRSCGTFSTPASTEGESIRVFFRFRIGSELDIWLYIPSGKYPYRPALFLRKRTRSGAAAQRLDCS